MFALAEKLPESIRRMAARVLPHSVRQRARSHVERRREELLDRAAADAGGAENHARIARRRAFAMSYYTPTLATIDEWAARFTEDSNFYYRLQPMNRAYLASLVASVTGRTVEEVTRYLDELEQDEALRSHLEATLKNSTYGRDIRVEYGRRLGWYAFTRILKPRIVVETGVDHGVGSCVLASALLRNRAEGSDQGMYYGTDINPVAGQLFRAPYAAVGRILYGDSIQSLSTLQGPIDLFINDSDHSAEYEYQEYLAVQKKLSPHAVVLGDNAHATDKLLQFSQATGRRFVYWAEQPANHWYPGAGIGISLPPQA